MDGVADVWMVAMCSYLRQKMFERTESTVINPRGLCMMTIVI